MIKSNKGSKQKTITLKKSSYKIDYEIIPNIATNTSRSHSIYFNLKFLPRIQIF